MLKESNPGVYKLNRLAAMEDAPYKFDILSKFLDVVKEHPSSIFKMFMAFFGLTYVIIYSGYIRRYSSGKEGVGWTYDEASATAYSVWPIILFIIFYITISYSDTL